MTSHLLLFLTAGFGFVLSVAASGHLINKDHGAFVLSGKPHRCYPVTTSALVPREHSPDSVRIQSQLFLSNTPPPRKEFDSSMGKYKFGDITRGLIKQVTGKDTYEFGDLSRHVIQRGQNDFYELTGKNESYQFGDLTKWAIANYTGKATTGESYEFGDISKAIIRRVRSGEYTLDDVLLALQVLISAGARLAPIAHFFPVKVLMDLIGFGLAQKVSLRVLEVLAVALDERFKAALMGDPKYQLGDKTKEQISSSIGRLTGKDRYEFGDISQAISRISNKNDKSSPENNSKLSSLMNLIKDQNTATALEEWDKKYQKRQENKIV